jgi:signal transduction histidine kinase
MHVRSKLHAPPDLTGKASYRLLEATRIVAWRAPADRSRFLYIAPHAGSLLGYPVDAWYEPGFWRSRVDPDDLDRMVASWTVGSSSTTAVENDYRMRAADDHAVWIHEIAAPARGPHGVDVLEGFLLDYSEQRRSEDLNRAITASLPGRVASIDRDGRIIAVNARWEDPREERDAFQGERVPVGADYLQADVDGRLAGGEPADEVAPCIRSVLAGESARFTVEYEWTGPRGRRWYEAFIERLDRVDGGAIISHLDITARRVAELEAIRLRDEATHIARLGTISELAASLSHDLTQPLAAILSNAQAAARLLDQGALAPDDLREILADIIADDRRAAGDVARIAGLVRRGDGVVGEVELNSLVRDVVRLVASEASVRRVSLVLTLDSSAPCVRGDRVRLEQLFLNLLMNAVEAAAIQSIGPRMVAVGTTAGAGLAGVVIRDSGPGIRNDVRGREFEPFVTTKSQGLGMGLPIARRIVQAHGGELTLESEHAGVIARCAFPIAVVEGV